MKHFALSILDSRGNDHFAEVRQFIGADTSGSFGILAGHIHLVAVLDYGLARFCDNKGVWRYLALPGGVLRFIDNRLTICTVRYFLGDDRDRICKLMADELSKADSEIHSSRATMAEIERSLLQRIVELSKHGSLVSS